MKQMLKAVPVLSGLLGVRPDLVRAHIKYGIGDIGKYCQMAPKHKTGKQVNQYYIMRSDLPKVLHRELTKEEEAEIDHY